MNIMNNKLSAVFLLLIGLGMLLTLDGCNSSMGENAPGGAANSGAAVSGTAISGAANSKQLETFVLQKRKITSVLQIPGELIAYRQVDLYAKVNSFVKDLKVDIGSRVTAGQLLVTLEAPELSAQLAAAESRMKSQEAIFISSNATYNRMLKTSNRPGTIAKNDLEIAKAKMESDLAQWDATKASYTEASTILQYLTISAPFNGVISSRNVNLGAYVGPSGKGSESPIFTLQELRHLRLVISIPEADKSYINLGDEVAFKVNALPGKIFTAKISRRADAMDTQLRAERIELDVYNPNDQLAPGMVAEAGIVLTGSDSAFVVPKSAVVNSTEGVYLIRSAGGKAVRLPVKKGMETDSLSEVFGDLHLSDRFVRKGTEEIRNGIRIQ
jgi:membrane fusion protein, multidrug efflux system